MKNAPFCILFLILLSIACKKQQELQPPTEPIGPHKIKIEILNGGNQWDTAGQVLKDTIVIKLTRADTLLKNYTVLFTDSSCFASATTKKQTTPFGLSTYSWTLNATAGTQRLKVSIYDSLLNIRDSVFVTAEGKLPDSTWLPGSCLPMFPVNTIAQLHSGRIICGLNMSGPPFYSDDSGQSWQKFYSFPNTYIHKICVGPNDEIYVATENNGIYFSGDKGLSWQTRSKGITDIRYCTDFSVLRSGKLMASTYFGGLFLSSDKGLNWTRISGTLNYNDRFYNLIESPSGELYTVTDLEELWKSSDNGATWSRQRYSAFYDVQSIFIDDNEDMYVGNNGDEGYLFKSTDKGSTWMKVYTTPQLPGVYDVVKGFSKKNSYFYFIVVAYGVMRTKDFINYERMNNNGKTYTPSSYLAANDGTVLISGYPSGLLYNRHP